MTSAPPRIARRELPASRKCRAANGRRNSAPKPSPDLRPIHENPETPSPANRGSRRSWAGVATMLTLPCDMTAWPPNTDDISMTVTRAPLRPSSSAADNPEIPAPTMITSGGWLEGAGRELSGGCSVCDDSDGLASAVIFDGAVGESTGQLWSDHKQSDPKQSGRPGFTAETREPPRSAVRIRLGLVMHAKFRSRLSAISTESTSWIAIAIVRMDFDSVLHLAVVRLNGESAASHCGPRTRRQRRILRELTGPRRRSAFRPAESPCRSDSGPALSFQENTPPTRMLTILAVIDVADVLGPHQVWAVCR